MEQISTIRKNFKNRLELLPSLPGVYIFKDLNDVVIYVGKATNLKKRVSSYFHKNSVDSRIEHLKHNINDFDINITSNQNNALLLESSLIKKFQPKYNIRLKDDKSYPYILIDLNEEFPKIKFTRNIVIQNKNNIKIFGPFSKVKDVRKTIDVLSKLFPYCTTHVKRCLQPCVNACTKDEYDKIINQIISFLDGDHDFVISELNNQMNTASKNLMFERAVRLRDQINSINEFYNLSNSKIKDFNRIDYIGFTIKKDIASFQLFESKYTNITNTFKFIMEGVSNYTHKDIISAFVNQYYLQKHDKPNIIILPVLPNFQQISSDFSKSNNKKIKFKIPMIGEKKRILNLAVENSKYNIDHKDQTVSDNKKTLEILKEKLLLNNIPKRIECYDISNTQGSNPVGSMVVFENGLPAKSEYRRFKIKSVNQINDYMMMQEMLHRRLLKLKTEGNSKSPDLILIDGGKGHLSASFKVLKDLEMENIPIASIAKKFEYIYIPNINEPLDITKLSKEGILLQKLRNEAHRFAIGYHRKLRSKNSLEHPLQNIKGIGPIILNRLLIKYKSLEILKNIKFDELITVKGINKSLANHILIELKK